MVYFAEVGFPAIPISLPTPEAAENSFSEELVFCAGLDFDD